MASLLITKTANGFFLFESNEQKHGCLNPRANIVRNDYIRFRTFFGENIEAEIHYSNITIGATSNFGTVEEVMDVLAELDFNIY